MVGEVLDTSLPTRNLMLRYLANVTKKSGVMPREAKLGLGTWVKLAEDFHPSERPSVKQWERIYLDIAGVPFFADPEMEEGAVVFDHPTQSEARGRFDGLQYLEI